MENYIEKVTKKEQISQQLHDQKSLRTSTYIPGEKNGKWSQDEHLKYIAYIDFYKEKMRSREKRRSNQFYNQMSNFIGTRNGLQCRSHHQKLEEKYIYTNKIIAAFKEKFDMDQYKQQLTKLRKLRNCKSLSKVDGKSEESVLVSLKSTKDAEIQTDLQGINFNYILADNTTVLIYPPLQGITFDSRALFYPSNLTFHTNSFLNFPETSIGRKEF